MEAASAGLSGPLRDAVQDVVALVLYVIERNPSVHIDRRALGVVTVADLLEQECPPVSYGYPDDGVGEVKRAFHPAPSNAGRFTGKDALRERLTAPLFVGEYAISDLQTADRVHYALVEFGSTNIQDLFRRPISPNGWHLDPEHPDQKPFWEPVRHESDGRPQPSRLFTSALPVGQLVVSIADDGSDECVSFRLVTATLSGDTGVIFRARGEIVRPSEQLSDAAIQDACELISDELGALCFAFLREHPFARTFRYGAALFFLQDWESCTTPHTAKVAIAEMIRLVKRSYVTLSQVIVDATPLPYERHPPIGLAEMLGDEFVIEIAMRLADLPFGEQAPGVALIPALPSRELTDQTGDGRVMAIMANSDRDDDAILPVTAALRMVGRTMGLSIEDR